MRTLESNKQNLKYSLLLGEAPVYELDDLGHIKYVEVDGERIPVETGDYEKKYSEPVPFRGNISMGGGEAEAKEFGIDVSAYDAVLMCEENQIPITETSLIWYENDVGYKDIDETIVDPATADYSVAKAPKSINFVRYVLKRRI